MHIPQNTLLEHYLDIISLLVEHDPATYVRELMLDADQLNFFLHDKARSQEILKSLLSEEKAVKEQEKKPKKEKAQKPPEQEQKEPAESPEPVEKKMPPRSQSTLFNGF
jgi:replication factor C large subunit